MAVDSWNRLIVSHLNRHEWWPHRPLTTRLSAAAAGPARPAQGQGALDIEHRTVAVEQRPTCFYRVYCHTWCRYHRQQTGTGVTSRWSRRPAVTARRQPTLSNDNSSVHAPIKIRKLLVRWPNFHEIQRRKRHYLTRTHDNVMQATTIYYYYCLARPSSKIL